MKKSILLPVFCWTLFSTLFAQTAFEKVFYHDGSRLFQTIDLAEFPDGKLLMLSMYGPPNDDLFFIPSPYYDGINILCTYPDGKLAWSKDYRLTEKLWNISDLHMLPDGRFLMVMVPRDTLVLNKTVVMADSTGEVLWARAFGSVDSTRRLPTRTHSAIKVNEEGDIFMTTTVHTKLQEGTTLRPYRINVSKISGEGELIWSRDVEAAPFNSIYFSPKEKSPYPYGALDLVPMSDGGVIVCNRLADTDSLDLTDTKNRPVIFRLGTNGEMIWEKRLRSTHPKESDQLYYGNTSIFAEGIEHLFFSIFFFFGQTDRSYYRPVFKINMVDGHLVRCDTLQIVDPGPASETLFSYYGMVKRDSGFLISVNVQPYHKVVMEVNEEMEVEKASRLGSQFIAIPYYSESERNLIQSKDGTVCGTDIFSPNLSFRRDGTPFLFRTAPDLSTPCSEEIELRFDTCDLFYLEDIELEVIPVFGQRDSVPVIVEPYNGFLDPEPDLPDTLWLCEEDPAGLTLRASLPHPADSLFSVRYLWSTGDTLPNLQVSDTGLYRLQVDFREPGCFQARDSTLVLYRPLPEVDILLQDSFCDKGSVSLLAQTEAAQELLWNTGSSDSLLAGLTAPGSYSVAAFNGCGEAEAFVELADSLFQRRRCLPEEAPCLFLPDIFTPNGDGVNDVFAPVLPCDDLMDYHLQVFNRWGQVVFETADPSAGWDGQSNGKAQPPDVYAWLASWRRQGQSQKVSGEVTLVR